ncbi:MAG: hypothetical protein CL534_24870 [Ahrensia sp.]|nr:hypothetical protein [Ahrensia sp.]
MKKIILSLVSAAFVSPAFAADRIGATDYDSPQAAPVSGSIGASVGALVATSDGDSETATVYNVNGKLNYRFDPYWNGQFDARYNGVTADGDTFSAIGGAVHIFKRDPSAYAVGGFAAYDWLSIDDVDGDLSSYRLGPEFQIYNGNITYYGQAFWGQYLVDGDSVGTWGARGEVRYFHTENLRFEGELGFTQISDGGDDASIFTAGLEAEKRFDGTPFSVWGRYQYDHVSVDGDSVGGHTFLAGFRAAFGTGSLFDEDRNGASMETPKSSQIF